MKNHFKNINLLILTFKLINKILTFEKKKTSLSGLVIFSFVNIKIVKKNKYK